jgi:hypothetical protein
MACRAATIEMTISALMRGSIRGKTPVARKRKSTDQQGIAKPTDVPHDVALLYQGVANYLDTVDDQGRKIGDAKCGVYAFYDYDAEPIYVGQTTEKVRVRIRRHLTNHRTDAVAMHVLDPFEVAEIEVWPLFDLTDKPKHEIATTLEAAEYTVYARVLKASALGAVLNEKDIPQTRLIDLPPSVRSKIVPDPGGHFPYTDHPGNTHHVDEEGKAGRVQGFAPGYHRLTYPLELFK